MANPITQYLSSAQQALASGHATEHTYRPALKALFEGLTKLKVHNEPKGSAHGRPDFIFTKGEIPVAWVEAKDLHINLDKVEKSEQMARYFGYANLILTNGLEFRFFKNGKRYGDSILLAKKDGNVIEANSEMHSPFERLIVDFIQGQADTIRSAEHLAQIMGGKAARLRDNITDMLNPEFTGTKGSEIEKIRDVLKAKLIHDLDNEQFADLYAQTLVYGLFVARYHDDTPETFTRSEARDKIPASNHLLQQFFDHIAGTNFEKKLSYIVDELCEVFRHSDVHALVHGLYLKEGDTHDPIIHFYEDFLREYSPELRSQRGVFYTPLPVVRFIVRSVDSLLKTHFGLPDGLADRSTTEWQRIIQGKKTKETIDRVQILDPAVGTGTFLHEVINHVHGTFKGQEGSWPKFVDEHLLGRLNGFELMMASYTIAHLKLSMKLAETGVKEIRKRLRVFLTNSLEEAARPDDSLFQFIGLQSALTEEAQLAAEVKRDLPIMVVLGNPPYSIRSMNSSIEVNEAGKKQKNWIGKLLDDYKTGLDEQNINALSDDYVKFIRTAEHIVERSGEGVIAMITNNSFLEGSSHKQMRNHLLQTFEHIYILNLHGSPTPKVRLDGDEKDKNVFDIKQSVSINIFLRSKSHKNVGKVHYIDLYGSREKKYKWLDENDVRNSNWQTLDVIAPNFYFVPKDLKLDDEYSCGQSLQKIFTISGSGIKFRKDNLLVSRHFSVDELKIMLNRMNDQSDNQILSDYETNETKDWILREKRQFFAAPSENDLRKVLYRPFDFRYAYYPLDKISQIIPRGDSREGLMRHLLQRKNLALLMRRSADNTIDWHQVFCSRELTDLNSLSAQTYIAPLYLDTGFNSSTDPKQPNVNLDLSIVTSVIAKLKLEWVYNGTGDGKKTCGPEDIFDYIYAVLHCPGYRGRYKEFLKIDFPRVPFTGNPELFWQLVKLGREVRGFHLLESPELMRLRTSYPVAGTDAVEKVRYEGEVTGKVWINGTQYFGDVPKVAWGFFVGGYEPAQKWLKDRKGRTLSSNDIQHYQKIIIALSETDRLMKEIDTTINTAGGWPMK